MNKKRMILSIALLMGVVGANISAVFSFDSFMALPKELRKQMIDSVIAQKNSELEVDRIELDRNQNNIGFHEYLFASTDHDSRALTIRRLKLHFYLLFNVEDKNEYSGFSQERFAKLRLKQERVFNNIFNS